MQSPSPGQAPSLEPSLGTSCPLFMKMCFKELFSTLVARKSHDSTGALCPHGLELWNKFCLSAWGKTMEKYWENELEYNNRLQSSKYMCKEYREYVREKEIQNQ